MRIVSVEDCKTQALSLRKKSEAMGHQVVEFPDGRRAWDHLRARGERLVITDWMMPEMNGLDLCRKIRAESRPPTPM